MAREWLRGGYLPDMSVVGGVAKWGIVHMRQPTHRPSMFHVLVCWSVTLEEHRVYDILNQRHDV